MAQNLSSPFPLSDVNEGPGINAITLLLMAIGVICVGLRCHVRLALSKNFGWDDGVMLFTLGILVASDVVIYKMVNVGAGRHLSSLEDPTDAALQLLKWNSVYQVLNVTGAFFTKLSIGLFLLRLKNTKRFSRIIWVFLAPLALTTAALDLVILLQCIPLEALWNQALHSRCISEQIPLTVSYVQSGFAIVTDLFLTISPVVILWKVRISVKRKAGICGLMSLGLMATISNALRNAYIPNLIQADFTYTIVPIVIVADLEFSLGVIAACIPTLMPLFRRRDTQMPYSRMTGVVWHGNTSGGSRPKRESSNPFTFDGPRTTAKADLEQQRSYVLNEMGTGNGIMLEHSYTVERAPAM